MDICENFRMQWGVFGSLQRLNKYPYQKTPYRWCEATVEFYVLAHVGVTRLQSGNLSPGRRYSTLRCQLDDEDHPEEMHLGK